MLTSRLKRTAIMSGLALALIGAAAAVNFSGPAEVQSMIVQGKDLADVRLAVEAIGGEIRYELKLRTA